MHTDKSSNDIFETMIKCPRIVIIVMMGIGNNINLE